MTKSRRGQGEGSLFQRKSDGRWTAILDLGIIDGRRQRKQIYGKTRKDVADRLRALQHDHEAGRPVATDKQTVAQFLNVWLDTVVKPSVRIATYQNYERAVRLHITPSLGSIKLTKLTAQDVQRLLSRLQQRVAASYVRNVRATLSIALTQARKWHLVSENVAALTTMPAVPEAEHLFLTPTQARQLLTAARGRRFEAVYRVALALGLRKAEVLGLRWQDVDFAKSTLTVAGQLQPRKGQGLVWVPPKTARSRRTLPLPASLAQALREHKHRQLQDKLLSGADWHETGYVFTSQRGAGVYASTVQQDFTALLKEAGLPHMTFHSLRHSCASLMVAEGVPPRVVMEVLGHSDMTLAMELYSHVMQDTMRDGTDAIERLLKERG